MKPIPVLGIPHYNRPDLTSRCIASIDYPVEHLVLIDQGEESISHIVQDLAGAADDAPIRKKIKKVTRIRQRNAGVAGAWNQIIKLFPAPWWLISNNDIAFAPGDLAKMAATVEEHQVGIYRCGVCGIDFTVSQFNANAGYCPHCCPVNVTREERFFLKRFAPGFFFGNHGASWFGITDECVAQAGLFDENIYPAYLEDCDYAYRCDLLKVKRKLVAGVAAVHGDERQRGSCTVNATPELAQKNSRTHGRNFDYYRAKWGGLNGQEKYTSPFNSPAWPVWAWKFDPAFRAGNQW